MPFFRRKPAAAPKAAPRKRVVAKAKPKAKAPAFRQRVPRPYGACQPLLSLTLWLLKFSLTLLVNEEGDCQAPQP